MLSDLARLPSRDYYDEGGWQRYADQANSASLIPCLPAHLRSACARVLGIPVPKVDEDLLRQWVAHPEDTHGYDGLIVAGCSSTHQATVHAALRTLAGADEEARDALPRWLGWGQIDAFPYAAYAVIAQREPEAHRGALSDILLWSQTASSPMSDYCTWALWCLWARHRGVGIRSPDDRRIRWLKVRGVLVRAFAGVLADGPRPTQVELRQWAHSLRDDIQKQLSLFTL